MKLLKRITVDRVMSFGPCPGWTRERVVLASGGCSSITPMEVAGLDLLPRDILWLLLREEFIPVLELRLIACWCAGRALRAARSSGREPDARSWAAVRVARRFAHGLAGKNELAAAFDDAAAAFAAVAFSPAAFAAAAFAAAAANTSWICTLKHVRRVLRRLEAA